VNSPVDNHLLGVGRGQLHLFRGQVDSAITELQPAVYALADRPNLSEYQAGCESLANAFQAAEQKDRVIPTLESCVRQIPPFVVGGWFNTTAWMYLRMRLADEYRGAGREADAQPLEQDLRKLLVLAEPTHPIVVKLKARSRMD
jgi:hypothetical protein